MKVLFNLLKFIYAVVGLFVVITSMTYILNLTAYAQIRENFFNNHTFLILICTSLIFCAFGTLYFFMRVGSRWLDTHTELENKLEESERQYQLFKKAKKVVDDYAIEKYSLTIEQIREKIHGKEKK